MVRRTADDRSALNPMLQQQVVLVQVESCRTVELRNELKHNFRYTSVADTQMPQFNVWVNFSL